MKLVALAIILGGFLPTMASSEMPTFIGATATCKHINYLTDEFEKQFDLTIAKIDKDPSIRDIVTDTSQTALNNIYAKPWWTRYDLGVWTRAFAMHSAATSGNTEKRRGNKRISGHLEVAYVRFEIGWADRDTWHKCPEWK